MPGSGGRADDDGAGPPNQARPRAGTDAPPSHPGPPLGLPASVAVPPSARVPRGLYRPVTWPWGAIWSRVHRGNATAAQRSSAGQRGRPRPLQVSGWFSRWW